MNTELITKVVDLVIKAGILTTIAIGVQKLVSSPKATESISTVVPSEDKTEEDTDE